MSYTFNHTRPFCPKQNSRLLLVIILTGVFLCCGLNIAAAADTPAKTNTEVATTSSDSTHSLNETRQTPSLAVAAAKALGALAVVLGLLMLLAAAIKKLGLSGQTPQGEGLIKVLETRMIAPKKYVAVLDIAGQTMAVGISEQQITLLTKLEPDPQIQALAQKPTSSRFTSLLAKAVKKSKINTQEDQA